MTTIALVTLLSGILIFILSLPLISRKIPMNGGYGIRIPAAFESEQRWYDINAYGGRQLAICLLQCHRKHHGCIEHEGSHVGDRATADLTPAAP